MANTETRKQVHFMVPAQVHKGLAAMAYKANMSLSSYAELLLVAAYSSRVRPPTGDANLDTTIARIVILWGSQLDTAAIAEAVGLHEAKVVDIIGAWRDAMRMVA